MDDDDTRGLERQLLSLYRLYPRLHCPNTSTGVLVERAEYALLRQLDIAGPQQLGHTARALDLDQSTITRLARLLTEKGLAHRVTPDDRRVAVLDLTESGRHAVREVTEGRISVLTAVMANWTPQDQQSFVGLLERFNAVPPARPTP